MRPLDLLAALRPRQWVKNLLVFAVLLFAHRLGDAWAVGHALLAFVLFCLVSSAVYLFNDLRDREKDRLHPDKRNRPIASGRVGAVPAAVLALLLLALALALAALTGPRPPRFVLFPLLYLVLNLLYTLRLKRVAILDALCIALGFLLRVVAGGEAIGAPCSSWLILCTLFVSLFLAFLKRRAELSRLEAAASDHRPALGAYSREFLDRISAPLAAMTVMAYCLYTVDRETIAKFGGRDLLLTVPFVLYGVFRYFHLALTRDEGGDPTALLLKDRPILLAGLLWLAACALIVQGWGPGL